MKQTLFILLSFFAQQTICADADTHKSTKTPAHSRQPSSEKSAASQAASTSEVAQEEGISQKVTRALNALLALRTSQKAQNTGVNSSSDSDSDTDKKDEK